MSDITTNNLNSYSHNGHMIKFQYFEKSSSLNCHFKNLGTFVVSIAHYMRAYFNYQALTHGNDFMLPGDVGFLNVSDFWLPSIVPVPYQHPISPIARNSLSPRLYSVCHAQGNCQEPISALRQNRMSTPRNIHVDKTSTDCLHR